MCVDQCCDLCGIGCYVNGGFVVFGDCFVVWIGLDDGCYVFGCGFVVYFDDFFEYVQCYV